MVRLPVTIDGCIRRRKGASTSAMRARDDMVRHALVLDGGKAEQTKS
jgi:hypothetical protein